MFDREPTFEPLDAATRTALDVVRPDGAGLDEPELASFSARLRTETDLADVLAVGQRLDRDLAAALHNVPLPGGLADRVVRTVSEVRPRTASHEDQPTGLSFTTGSPSPAASGYVTRRTWLWATSGSVAVAAAIALGVWWWQQPEAPLRPGQLLEAAIALCHEEAAHSTGEPLATAPRGYPLSEELYFDRPLVRWRRLDHPLAEQSVVAYDLTRGRIKATLLVLRKPNVTGLLDRPPISPTLPPTQGVCASAWEIDGLVYVLVVQGGDREYQEFLRDADGTYT